MEDKSYIFVVDFHGVIETDCKSILSNPEFSGRYEVGYFKTDDEVLGSFGKLKNKSMLKLLISETEVRNNGGFELTKKLRRNRYRGV